jgi:hypothetical protein
VADNNDVGGGSGIIVDLELKNLQLYVTTGTVEGVAMRFAIPAMKMALSSPIRPWIDKAVARAPEGLTDAQRARKWTILAEAKQGKSWRNVTLQGSDFYGLTAELLASGADRMASDGYDVSGVVAPVQAVGRDLLVDELTKAGVSFETYAPV